MMCNLGVGKGQILGERSSLSTGILELRLFKLGEARAFFFFFFFARGLPAP